MRNNFSGFPLLLMKTFLRLKQELCHPYAGWWTLLNPVSELEDHQVKVVFLGRAMALLAKA